MARVNRDRPLLPTFGIALNAQDRTRQINMATMHVAVDDDLDLPGMFTFELVTQDSQPDAISWADASEFELGASVEVSFGYQDQGLAPLIQGEITSLEPRFWSSGPATLLVRGYDRRHRLNGSRRTRTFLAQKDSDIATQVCQDAHVAVDATDSGVTHDFMVQADQTDLEFLLARARKIHYELAMVGRTLLFRPVANDKEVVLTLGFDDDLLEFQPRLSLMPLTELRVLAWDLKRKDTFLSLAGAGDEQGSMGGVRSGATRTFAAFNEARTETLPATVASQAEADRLALARFNSASLDFIKGSGRCRGRNDLRVGSVIEIVGVGARFSGLYYVTSTLHSYTPRDGYTTRFQVRRNAS